MHIVRLQSVCEEQGLNKMKRKTLENVNIRKISKTPRGVFMFFITLFLVCSIIPGVSYNQESFARENPGSSELENRNCIRYPNNEKPKMEDVFNTSFGNHANVMTRDNETYWNIPGGPLGASAANDQGGIYASQKIDILNNDFSVTYCISHSAETAGSDFGNTFSIFNDDTFTPQSNLTQSRSSLGLYRHWRKVTGKTTSLAPNNSLAVEFDVYNYIYGGGAGEGGNNIDQARLDNRLNALDSEGNKIPIGMGIKGPHIAITEPDASNSINVNQANPLPHYAVSIVGNDANGKDRFHDGRWGTARVEWVLLDPGSTDSPSDNIYRFRYSYWYSPYAIDNFSDPHSYWKDPTGEPVMGRIPDLTGYKDYTFAEMAQKFGFSQSATQMPVTMAVTSSTDSIINKSTWFKFPSKYEYRLNYYIKKSDGTLTKIPVPGIEPNPLIGSATEGPITLPQAPNISNYKFDQQSSDSRDQTIRASFNIADNTFNYYYTENKLAYTVEYYNNGTKIDTKTGNVTATNPKVTSIDISNKPTGSEVVRYEFPAGTTTQTPSEANPYTITEANNVIKVYYKSAVIENPNDDQKADEDYVLVTFDANDLVGDSHPQRGRLNSKKTTTLKNQEQITYAVLKTMKWKDFANEWVAPDVVPNEPYWLNTDESNRWKTEKNGTGSGLPLATSDTLLKDVMINGAGGITYYAQYNTNTITGTTSVKNNEKILIFTSFLILLIILSAAITRKKLQNGN